MGLAADLEAGNTSSRKLVEDSLARIADPAGEGKLTFLSVDEIGARAAADFQDLLRKRGRAPSAFAGIPFSSKDLFDLAGEVTTSGSVVLRDASPANRDADAIASLKAAGLVVLGRTNMTEFAYSGVGLNAHYGTPRSPFEREVGRIPGGSSSGAAVSVADRMCSLGIGTDTGGSCRIPAAYCGVTGYKPTAGRISTRGAYPLSTTFDSIGPLANSVACCAVGDAIMANDWDGEIALRKPGSLRLGVLTSLVMDGLDGPVADDFDRAIHGLRQAGVAVGEVSFPDLLEMPALMQQGDIASAEAFAHHRQRLEGFGDRYDPRVSSRMLVSAGRVSAAGLITVQNRRKELIRSFDRLMDGIDALVMPTTPIIPPPISELADEKGYVHVNRLSLRNTSIGNFLGGCALSLPMHRRCASPTGFMLLAPAGRDQQLFAVAAVVEAITVKLR
jgi:aspartyl-tRNA(Asn)/glutamyl-tRNA(Gln) amidotransferase subunit A